MELLLENRSNLSRQKCVEVQFVPAFQPAETVGLRNQQIIRGGVKPGRVLYQYGPSRWLGGSACLEPIDGLFERGEGSHSQSSRSAEAREEIGAIKVVLWRKDGDFPPVHHGSLRQVVRQVPQFADRQSGLRSTAIQEHVEIDQLLTRCRHLCQK